MSENSRKREIGELHADGHYDAVFTWKIPNVSSIPHVVDYVVQSPSFSYEGASWIFKMHPYGLSEGNTKGHIDLKIERLRSEFDKHDFNIRIYIGSAMNKDFLKVYAVLFAPSSSEETLSKIMQNLKEHPKKSQLAPNDIFTLVFAFNKREIVSKTQTDVAVVGKTCRNTGIQEIGEIFKDNFNLECFYWKICNFSDIQFPDDYQFQSPPFSFASATWILKIYPYFFMPQSSNPSFDVVLERLNSEIDHHFGILHLRSDFKIVTDWNTAEFFIDVHHTQGSALTFKLKEEDIPNLRCLHFRIEVKVKVDAGIDLGSPTKFVKPTTGYIDTGTLPEKKICHDFKELFLNQEFCDVIIKVKGEEFRAHKAILAARSPVLASTFRNDMKEKATGILNIEDCHPSFFPHFLHFLYCGSVENLTPENVFSLFTTADKYDVQDLKLQCLEFIKMNLTVDTFCDTVTLAFQHSEKELLDLIFDFFPKNFLEILVTVKWQTFLTENPIQGNEIMIKSFGSKKK